uniref:Uncharacterized protein n=1 Tax=Nicotiana tabacum TaxID=4097 RepID=A0A1S4B3G8_TOBAC|nr:PREDICTED: uncharacterized protein LOC107804041 [Nicotiana tabacum]
MAKTSKTVPQKEKTSSSQPAGDKTPVEPHLDECVPGGCELTSDFKVKKDCHWEDKVVVIPATEEDITTHSWVRNLVSTSSYAERSWCDLERGQWEARNHGLRENAVMRPPSGEEESSPPAPKPTKDKKSKRVSTSEDPKPKKCKAHKSKKDTAILPVKVVQRLREEEEENEDDGSDLAALVKRNTESTKASKSVRVGEIQPRTERISEMEDVSSRDEHLAGMSEGTGSEALPNEENAPSDSLGAKEIGDSVPLHSFSEGEVWEAQAMKVPQVEGALGEDLFQSCFAGVNDLASLNNLDFRRELSRYEAEIRGLTEEKSALKLLGEKKEMEIKGLRAELAMAQKEQSELSEQVNKVVDIYGLGGDFYVEAKDGLPCLEKEAAQAYLSSTESQLQGMKEKSLEQAKKMEELHVRFDTKIAAAKYEAEAVKADAESRRETLEEIHARSFNLVIDIENAKELEAEAEALLSSDDDDSGSASGSESGGEPDGEDVAPEDPDRSL